MQSALQPALWRTKVRRMVRGATADLRDAVAGHTLLLFSVMLALTVLWTADALGVTPGYEDGHANPRSRTSVYPLLALAIFCTRP